MEQNYVDMCALKDKIAESPEKQQVPKKKRETSPSSSHLADFTQAKVSVSTSVMELAVTGTSEVRCKYMCMNYEIIVLKCQTSLHSQYLPVKQMSQLFSNVYLKAFGDLKLVAIVVMVSDNNTVAQKDNIQTYYISDIQIYV